MIISPSEIDPYLMLMINAIFTGIGVAIGQPIGAYISRKYFHGTIKMINKEIKTSKIDRKLKKLNNQLKKAI
jgi:hypothetical protein